MDFLPLYLKFYQISIIYSSKYAFNSTRILQRSRADGWFQSYGGWANWFVVEDVAVNSVYADAWHIMALLAPRVWPGLEGAERKALYDEYHQRTVEAMKKYLWREEEKMFGARYRDVDGEWKSSSRRCLQSIVPILLMKNADLSTGNNTGNNTGLLEKKQIDALIGDISDKTRFWTAYPFPSVSLDEPTYTPVYRVNLMWRGPSWAFPSWMIIKGLQGVGRGDLAASAVDRWKKGVQEQGVWEMWNAETGLGYGAKGLGMSCIIADLL
jgi:glycogen debranching enzyme